jgi:ABC-type Fe3+/spermidine/putrescine transport system ATPase subunit
MAEPLVELVGISKSYGAMTAVAGLDLSIAKGEFVVLLGPSGSGKTTVLSMIGGFIDPDAGHVRIGGADVTRLPPAKRPTATVFQDYALFPHMSVRANVGFGLAMRKVPKAERDARAEDVLRLVGLEGFGGRGIHQLSGGQRQRVALARAIAVNPAVLLLDEPLGALDPIIRSELQADLRRIFQAVAKTVVLVTHDLGEAAFFGDRLVLLRGGWIVQQGPFADLLERPADPFVTRFINAQRSPLETGNEPQRHREHSEKNTEGLR